MKFPGGENITPMCDFGIHLGPSHLPCFIEPKLNANQM